MSRSNRGGRAGPPDETRWRGDSFDKPGRGSAPVSALGALPAGVVDGILPAEEDLRDGDEGIALLEEGLDDGGQGLRGMEGGVVEQDDGAGLDLGGHPLDDLSGGQVLPVQAVHERNDRKFLPDKCTFLMPI